MTPELKTACEVVFQEHKTSSDPIAWNRDAFRGRLSIGLCEKAKETLVSKNIIHFPRKTKKTFTILNPDAATATTFEEAMLMVQHRVPPPLAIPTPIVEDIAEPVSPVLNFEIEEEAIPATLMTIAGDPGLVAAQVKWYMKPLFFYIIWPVVAGAIGVLIAFLMSEYVEMINR